MIKYMYQLDNDYTKEQKMTNKFRIGIVQMIILMFTLTGIASFAEGNSEDAIQLIVDGMNITELSSPVIENDRMLVPIRFVSEEVGAEVDWDDVNRMVSVEKDNRSMHLWIGSRLVEYNNGEIYKLSDVAPKIINDRTYVPLRVVSNALEIGIRWDESTRTVYVDSDKSSVIESSYDVEIVSHNSGDVITEKSVVKASIPESYKDEVEEVKLLLLDVDNARGYVVANEKGLSSNLSYIPKVEDAGKKVLVFSMYDINRKFIAGDSISINVDVKPEVSLLDIESEITDGNVTLGQEINFLAKYVNYELTNLENGKIKIIKERDPEGTYSWTPSTEENGSYKIKVIAYDGNGLGYESQSIVTNLNINRKLSLSGVSEGMTIDKPVNLIASRNFDVSETEYIIKDINSNAESNIATIPYGAYKWFPDSEYTGGKQLKVRVKDVDGVAYDSEWINVNIDGSPKLFLYGIGPKQVLTDKTDLSVRSNVDLDSVSYVLTNSNTGARRYIGSDLKQNDEQTFNPLSIDSGDVTLHAEATYQGRILLSEKVSFKVYLGALYGPKAVIEKDKFLGFASGLAKDSFDKTGMSAALQTAQAILETAWGQRLPVDKYSGQFSYNLFGIKGTGTNGSVISNTWEVYNGISYRVDANFRAYNNVNEAWEGHKGILLNLSRYEPFREVMFDSTLGAWAVRRAGYATDPRYPMKLMNIIDRYDLNKLDEVGVE